MIVATHGRKTPVKTHTHVTGTPVVAEASTPSNNMTPKEVDAVLALWNKEFKVQMKDFEFKTSRKLIFAAFRHLVFIIRKEELGQNPVRVP